MENFREFKQIGRNCDLKEKGKALLFEMDDLSKSPGFAIKVGGQLFAYINSCPHTGSQLDWDPGDVFDQDGDYLICATHGALFDCKTGVCVSGPCVKQRLTSVPVKLVNGIIYVKT